MRLAERLFAFWRLPSRSDPVQILLWILGWALVVSFVGLLASAIAPWIGQTGFLNRPGRGLVITAILVSFFSMAGWFVAGCWFVSEAYRGWRAGHRHGRQWTVLIAALLLLGVLGLAMGDMLDPIQRALFAIEVAFGIALLVACFFTKLPAPPVVATA
jgi:hypothetical protein